MQTDVLISIILPAALFFIMLGMGLGLRPENFKKILLEPKAIGLGLSAQLIMLPALCWLVVSFSNLAPAIATGLLILSFCPSGTTSNIYTLLCRGDVALSISLTAIISLITPFTIPILTHYTLMAQLGEASSIQLPIGKTIIQLIIITLVPVGLGMLANHFKADLCRKLEKPFKILSLIFLFIIIAGIVKKNWTTISTHMLSSGLTVLSFNVLALIIGYGLARIARLPTNQATTICFEIGIQNGTTALLVTSTLLNMPLLTIGPVIYSLLMFVTGALFGLLLHWTHKQDTP
jgi:BASS family bile acid:Na+ symporter